MGASAVNLLKGAAATAGDKTVVDIGKVTPFLPGRTVRAIFNAQGQAGGGQSFAIDGSEDNSTWVADVAVSTVANGEEAVDCKCYRYMRPSVTAAAATPGTLSINLEANG